MRWLPKIVLAGVVLGLLSAAGFLIPPHLQVNRVEPDLPSDAELRALMAVENGPVAVHFINTSEQSLPEGLLGHTVFLIEWANGDLFMIDAGMDRVVAIEFGRLIEIALGAEEAVPLGTVAEFLGDDTKRVVGVGFTHLHIDHSQGIVPFCKARGPGAKVYQTSWQAKLHNFNTEEGAAIVAESCLQIGTLSGNRIMTVEGLPGLGIVGLGGHTPGSTLFVIAVDDRLWLLSGDTTNSKANLLSNTGKGFIYSYLLVPENTARTEALRLWFAGLDAQDDMTVLVSHDISEIRASGVPEYKQHLTN